MNMGAAVDIDDLQLLSSEYLKLKEKGVDVSGLDNKINSIKKNYTKHKYKRRRYYY